MEERRVAEYFVVAGLPANPTPLREFSCDGATLKSTHSLPPITDIAVINRSLGEVVPDGFTCIETTPNGFVANVNHGALRASEIFLCYRRGRDKQPLVDVGVLYEGRERVMADSQIVEFTPSGRSANINPSGQTTYMTYRRASERSACNELVVSDICVIMTSRGEQAPHSYCTIDRNLNKGTMVGSDIYVCYKKSMHRSNYMAYMAGILDHYPSNHYPGFPIPADLALFCLPMGATLESWPAKSAQPQPVFSTFVLTVTAGGGNMEAVEKVYGAAVSFYEKYPHELLTEEQKEALKLNEHFGRNNVVHTSKCICILSRWPFFDTFDKFLRYLHTMANSGPHHVPIERYVHHFVECVPFPSARKPRILIQLDAKERISLAQPEDLPINLSGAKFRQLVMTLRPEGCLLVLLFALTEQKILLHSLRPDVLTAVAEAITMIIFPFHWQCPYIPLCPLGLSDFLNAPIPFLLGLDSRFFDLYHPPTDVICIDLDTGAMSVPDDKKFLITKLLPRRPARTLRASLDSLCEKIHKFEKLLQMHLKAQKTEPGIDTDFKMKRKEQQLDVEIQEAFLRFTATILKGYSHYLLPIVSAKAGAACDTSSLFDIDAFVKSRDKNFHKFYQLMVNTQMFSKFIEERSFVSDKDASLAFFDDCAEKVSEDDTNIRLLELEPAQSEHTLFLPPPEPINLPEGNTYSYNGFPKLKPELFPLLEPKPVLPPQVKQPQATPASPLARRTKHEVKSAQKLALRHAQTPILWAKCLLSTCYSLWYTHLPAFATTQHHKARFLQLAFKILTNMQKLNLSQSDEVSYRVMMQLCGLYSQPILAVKVLCEMRQHGITPNAITYGYYNRAVMESKWTHSNLFWKKLRNVVVGVAAFKRSGLERSQRRKSSLSLDEVDKCLTDADSASRVSLESGASLDSHPPAPHTKTDTLSSDPGYCSVSETSESVSSPGAPPTAVPVLKDSISGSGVPPSSTSSSSFSFPPVTSCSADVTCPSPHLSSVATTITTNTSSSPSSPPMSLALQSVPMPSSSANSASHPSSSAAAADSSLHSESSQPSGNATAACGETHSSLCSHSVHSTSSSTTTSTTTTCTSTTSGIPSTTESSYTSLTPSTVSMVTPSFSSSSSSSSLATIAPILSTLICPSQSSSSPSHLALTGTHTSTQMSLDPASSSSFTTTSSTSASSSSFSSSCATSRALDFSESDALRARLGSIVRSSAAGLASGADLLVIEYNVAFSSSAGLLMSSALDSTVFDAASRSRQRPTDLADALSPTLDQYDKMSEATAVRTSPEAPTSSVQDKGVPEYLSNSSSRLGLASNMASTMATEGLRQASKQIEHLRSQYLDPAMADLGQYSPGNFSYRKNEIISGSISSVKSAVTSFSKRFGEIREAISATNTPAGRGVHRTSTSLPTTSFFDNYFRSRPGEGDGDEDSLDGLWSRRESAEVQGFAPLDEPLNFTFGAGAAGAEGEAVATQQDLFPLLGWDPQGPFCLGLWLTSCTRCHNCAALLYDEEIMAGWRPDDSNLNTKCTFCEKVTVPLLTINIYDMRHEPRPNKQAEEASEAGKSTTGSTEGGSDSTDRGLPPEESSKEEGKADPHQKDQIGAHIQKKGIRCEPITVLYLSPLVLRKELETVLSNEGDTCLTDTAFTDHHPILYWNLLWYYCRLRVPSHLPGLCLGAASVTRDRVLHPSWAGADWQNVYIRCLWDNTKYHEELGQPMYVQWQVNQQPSPLVSALVKERQRVPRDVMQSVITAIHMDDLTTAMKKLLTLYQKRPSHLKRNHFPIYRDLLFLACSCIPPAQLNLTSFDREYRRAYERNEPYFTKLLSRSDTPPPIAAVFCRRYFSQLSL
ncbi:DENN domain-containing protein Crag-like isoform X11 [Penaeus japonicus]|uniref:DENN domain-containing protein Crag-like isoform X11 n=1 Tax=Penaeus japonicus TaxID=27405 RepID=UPI001C710367|nr:DENN domain-containing protein Crag-like isoform X11 [Penaeus japonicus]